MEYLFVKEYLFVLQPHKLSFYTGQSQSRELEKKFSGKHMVFIIAQQRILPKPTRKASELKQKWPILRTLVAVADAEVQSYTNNST